MTYSVHTMNIMNNKFYKNKVQQKGGSMEYIKANNKIII